MGFWGSLGNAISSAVSTVCSGISSICSSIGGSLMTSSTGIAALAAALIPGVGLPEIILAVQLISEIVGLVADILDIKNEDESPEELAYAAEKAEKKPEDFDSTNEYIQYIREEMKAMDKEEFNNIEKEDMIKYKAVGSSILIKGIEEKYDMSIPADFWTTAAKLEINGENVKTYLDVFKKHGIETMKDMSNYLENKGTQADVSDVSNAMMDAMKKIYPDISDKEIMEKISDMENRLEEK